MDTQQHAQSKTTTHGILPGGAVAAPIKPKTKIKTKTKQKHMKHALLNATNATSAAESNSTTTTRCIQKHLPPRISTFK
jgi:hypothetical protein